MNVCTYLLSHNYQFLFRRLRLMDIDWELENMCLTLVLDLDFTRVLHMIPKSLYNYETLGTLVYSRF